MGGSGLKTVREIRAKKREGDFFLFIDTDATDLVGFSEREQINLADINVQNYLSTSSSADTVRNKVDVWLDKSARLSMKQGPLSDGASANRPQGRLAIASIATKFQNKLKEVVKGIDDINTNDVDKLNVFIVLSVAGGTGSSIYLDLTQIIYDSLYKIKGHDFKKPTVVFYMPDVFVGFQEGENIDRYKTNVFAFWKEIDAIQRDYFGSIDQSKITSGQNDTLAANNSATRSTYFSEFAIIADKHVQGKVPFQAFQSAILIDHKNTEGQATDIKQRYKDVARLLEMISVKTYGGSIKSALDNTILPNAVTSINNKLPWVKQYWSAGYAEIRGGSDLFMEYVKFNLKHLIYEVLLGVNGATKTGVETLIKPLMQDNLLSFIERNNYVGYVNKAREENGKLKNLYALIEKYWNEKISANLELKYKDGIESKNDESGDGIKRIFDNELKDSISNKLMQFVNSEGFQIDDISNKVLNEFYVNLSEIALTNGLQNLSFALEELDTRIDDLSMNYATEWKGLADKKTNVIIEDQEIINRNIPDSIIMQYAAIKNGPSMLKGITGKKDWYETELIKFKNLVKAYYDYQAEELALKLKKEICDKISLGKSGNMIARDNIDKLKNLLQAKLDTEITPNAHKNLIREYLSYKNNALTTIIPDVSEFAETEKFTDSKINIFKKIFENECGLATGINDGKVFFINKRADKTDSNSKSIEELLRIVFNDNKFLLTNIQSGKESAAKFIESLESLIEEKLIINLKSILTKGQSADNKPTGYALYASYTLNEWITQDPASFNAIKKQYDKRSSVFCHLINANPAKQLWLSPKSLTPRIEEIYKADGNNNLPKFFHEETNEDAIISIKYIDNLSFDNYNLYDQYKTHYKICLKSNINNYYPHIDVRFKNAMGNFLHDVENQKPILNVLAQGANQSSSGEQEDKGSKNTGNVKNFLKNYAWLYFLAKFYEKLSTVENKSIYNNLVTSDIGFKDTMATSSSRQFNPPTYIDEGRISFMISSDISKLKDSASKIWLSGSVKINSDIEILTTDKLVENLTSVMLLNEDQPSNWDLLETHSTDTGIIEINKYCIKKRYAMTSEKTKYKNVLTETINEVKTDIMSLKPDNDEFKPVFSDFFVSFTSELNKLIN